MEGAAASASASCPFFGRRQSSKRDFSTMADGNRSTSPDSDSLFIPEDDHYNNGHASHRPLTNRLALPRRPSRFAGDGLDYRRPIMSAGGGANAGGSSRNPAMVIDLTEEDESEGTNSHATPAPTAGMAGSSRAQRLPRYGRNIIDMTSDAEDEPSEAASTRPNFADYLPPPGHRNPHDHHPRISLLRRPQRHNNTDSSNMDDLEFVESRPRSRPQTVSRSNTPAVPAQRSVTPYPTGFPTTIDLTEDDDDVVHLDTRTRQGHGVNMTSPGVTAGIGTRSTAERTFDFTGMLQTGSRLLQRLGTFGGALDARIQQGQNLNQDRNHHAGMNGNRQHNDNEPHLRFAPPPRTFNIAMAMDYDVTGFDMGIMGGNRPPTPKYEPPEPAAEGFTRSPGEDEVVVCPNCGDELAVGDSEKKQEVWVVKKCGHVYCGDCAENRVKSSSKGSKKGKGKAGVFDGPQPFKQCVVDGCNQPATIKSMVRVFFGG